MCPKAMLNVRAWICQLMCYLCYDHCMWTFPQLLANKHNNNVILSFHLFFLALFPCLVYYLRLFNF